MPDTQHTADAYDAAQPVYPVLCDERCYDLASYFLEDESGLNSHRNANALGAVIEQAIEGWVRKARDNYDGGEL